MGKYVLFGLLLISVLLLGCASSPNTTSVSPIPSAKGTLQPSNEGIPNSICDNLQSGAYDYYQEYCKAFEFRNSSYCKLIPADARTPKDCLSELAYLTHNSTVCDGVDDPDQRWSCKAKALGDSDLCLKVSIQDSNRFRCYQSIASVSNDSSICEKLAPAPALGYPYPRSTCYLNFAIQKKDQSLCNLINETVVEGFSAYNSSVLSESVRYCKDTLRFAVAVTSLEQGKIPTDTAIINCSFEQQIEFVKLTNVSAQCSAVQNQSPCLGSEFKPYCLAVLNKDENFCYQLDVYREQCFSSVAIEKQDVTLCHESKDSDSCLLQYAQAFNDSIVCAGIEKVFMRDSCYSNLATFHLVPNLCASIEKDSSSYNSCYTQIAKMRLK